MKIVITSRVFNVMLFYYLCMNCGLLQYAYVMSQSYYVFQIQSKAIDTSFTQIMWVLAKMAMDYFNQVTQSILE